MIAESMMSLKCAVEEVVIRYNRFDVTVISVKENSVFIKELYTRCGLDSKGHTDK
jgi:Na+-transporting NADH:ubiquinone oxidoreductase subunit NqrF